MAAFTPGPWHTGTDEDAHMVYDSDCGAVADTLRDDGDAEAEAGNARLIAASPKLLAALTRLEAAADVFAADQSGATDCRCGLVQPVTVAECEELRAAIAAARAARAEAEATDGR